jgi:hypothetical protein
MKLRILGNSIRLRLSRSEMEHFAATGRIIETVEFGSDSDFTYSLTTGESLSATHHTSGIQIVIPHHLAHDWTGTDRVSVAGEMALNGGRTLQILLEKDFKCIHKSSHANEDAYPNPLSSPQ